MNLNFNPTPFALNLGDPVGMGEEEWKKKKKAGQEMAAQLQKAGGPVQGVDAQINTDSSWYDKKPKGFLRKVAMLGEEKPNSKKKKKPGDPAEAGGDPQSGLLKQLMGMGGGLFGGGGGGGGGVFGY